MRLFLALFLTACGVAEMPQGEPPKVDSPAAAAATTGSPAVATDSSSSASTFASDGGSVTATGGCCEGHGTCSAPGDAPSSLLSRLVPVECDTAQVCVPKSSGARCAAGAGVCVSHCLGLMPFEHFLLDPGGCAEGEVCGACIPMMGLPGC